MNTRIVFNGKEYASADAMPPEVRQAYEQLMDSVDSNRNGVPDLLEGASKGNPATAQNVTLKIAFNGREYGSLEEMPAAARQVYEALVKAGTIAAKGQRIQIPPLASGIPAEDPAASPSRKPGGKAAHPTLDHTQPLWLLIAFLLFVILVLLGLLGYAWFER